MDLTLPGMICDVLPLQAGAGGEGGNKEINKAFKRHHSIMKSYTCCAALVLMSSVAFAWLDLRPNYEQQKAAADMVAVTEVKSIQDAGNKKQLKPNSKLLFRQIEVQLKVVSLLKGVAVKTNEVKCLLWRFPTEAERISDHGDEAKAEYGLANPWESSLFVPKLNATYLAYLKRTENGNYVPATGDASIYSLIRLEVPFTSDPDEQAKK